MALVNIELNLQSADWGEANWNPMVRAYGLKKDRKAKCKSCIFYNQDKRACQFTRADHTGGFCACTKYQNRNKKQPSK